MLFINNRDFYLYPLPPLHPRCSGGRGTNDQKTVALRVSYLFQYITDLQKLMFSGLYHREALVKTV